MTNSEQPDHLPPWLRGVPLPPRPPAAMPGIPLSPSDSGDLPPWLLDDSTPPAVAQSEPQSTASAAGSETNDFPSWLFEDTPPKTPVATPTPSAVPQGATLPDWLTGSVPADQPAAAQADDLPDWLRSEAPQSSSGDVPDWLRQDVVFDTVAPTPADEPVESVDESSVPDWLQQLRSDTDSGLPEATTNTLATPDVSAMQLPDWLLEPEPSNSASNNPPAVGSADTTLPDWLSSATAPADEPRTNLPDWLSDEAPSAGSSVQSEAPDLNWFDDVGAIGATAFPSDVPSTPSWLQAGAAEPSSSVPGSQAAPVEDLPDWLRGDQAGIGEAASTSAQSVPDWLSSDAGDSSQVPAWLSADPKSVAPNDNVPDWLKPTAEQPAAPTGAAWLDEPQAHPQTPDWVKGDQGTAIAAPNTELAVPPSVEAPAPPAFPVAAVDLPPWLRDEPSGGATAGLPPWLADQAPTAGPGTLAPWLQPAETPLPASPPPAPVTPIARVAPPPTTAPATTEPDQGLLGGIELPRWLGQPEPVAEPTEERRNADARSLDWLSRLGPQDDDATPSPTTPIVRMPLPASPVRSEAHIEAVTLLNQLTAEKYPERMPLPDAPLAPAWRRIGADRVLHVLLLVALLVLLIVPSLSQPFAALPSVPSATPLHQQIEQLNQQSTVLLAYEWDVRRISELRPLEDAVLQHVIARQAKIVSLSTDPQGALLSYQVLDRLSAANYQPRGVDYLLLGYKPGGEFALRQIAQNFPRVLARDFNGDDANITPLATGALTGRPLTSIQSVALIVVMADDPSDVQGWIEQIHSRAPDVPIAFLLPAEANPVIQPYTTMPNVYYLAGRQGALGYQALMTTNPDALNQVALEAGQQRLGTLLFVVLLLVGAVIVLIGGRAERKGAA